MRPATAASNLFISFSAQLRLGVNLDALAARLVATEGLLRAKGIAVGSDGQSQLLQVVGSRWQITPVPGRGLDRLVVIGLQRHAESLAGLKHDATLFALGDVGSEAAVQRNPGSPDPSTPVG